jgi:hypothetical protein
VKRREFITLLGGAAAAWPFTARAQQPGKAPRIGFLGAASAAGYARQLEGFRLGLRDLGYIEGTNIVIEYRWAQGKYEHLRELVAELIRSNVDIEAIVDAVFWTPYCAYERYGNTTSLNPRDPPGSGYPERRHHEQQRRG